MQEQTLLPQMLQYNGDLVTLYPQVDQFSEEQLKIFWLPDEIKVEKDVQDILVNMTPAEKHGVITALRLFTLYELKAGAEYWGGKYKRIFKRSEFQRMAVTFAMVELSIHKPFYQKINELLHLHTNEFYSSYVESPALKERMDAIDAIVSSKDNLVSLGGFTFVEGVVLYGSFAFLKHFQSQGKNKILNIVRGLNFSVRDENIHAVAGAWTFKQLRTESKLSEHDEEKLHKTILHVADQTYKHECDIIDMIFSEGPIDGINATQMKQFIQSRINQCLIEMGYKPIYEVDINPIADWFYTGINGFTFNDTFSGVGAQYHRNWDETAFVYAAYDKTPHSSQIESTSTNE